MLSWRREMDASIGPGVGPVNSPYIWSAAATDTMYRVDGARAPIHLSGPSRWPQILRRPDAPRRPAPQLTGRFAACYPGTSTDVPGNLGRRPHASRAGVVSRHAHADGREDG